MSESKVTTNKQKYQCSRSLARELLVQKSPATFYEIFDYVKEHLWQEWRENNSHLSERELIKKKCGELSKLLTYDTNFYYNSFSDSWSLVNKLDESDY